MQEYFFAANRTNECRILILPQKSHKAQIVFSPILKLFRKDIFAT